LESTEKPLLKVYEVTALLIVFYGSEAELCTPPPPSSVEDMEKLNRISRKYPFSESSDWIASVWSYIQLRYREGTENNSY
jgi:hypothetical protein